MKKILFSAFLFPALCFGQFFERRTDASGNMGVQANDVLASGSGRRKGEAYYFNALLYYRNSYLIPDDEVLGTLTGRITRTYPLSSLTFDQLESIRNPQAVYSNLLKSYPQYANALNNYDLFIRIFENSVKEAAENAADPPQTYNYYDYNYNLDEILEEAPPAEPAGSFYEGEEFIEENTYELSAVQRPQRVVLQNISNPRPAEPFPPLNEVLKDASKSLSAKELEFIIRYEELTRAYSNTVIEYQKALAARRSLEQMTFFDAADPTEHFRIVVSSEDHPGLVWIQTFTLNGGKNYQSYDKDLWFLRYELPLRKKDVRALAGIFAKSKAVSVQISGRGGEEQNILKDAHLSTLKQIFEDYSFGKMILNTEVFDSPLLRDNL